MSSPTKIQKLETEMKSVFDKASDAFNLMMATKMERESIKNFKSNSSTYLRIITEKKRKMRK